MDKMAERRVQIDVGNWASGRKAGIILVDSQPLGCWSSDLFYTVSFCSVVLYLYCRWLNAIVLSVLGQRITTFIYYCHTGEKEKTSGQLHSHIFDN